MELEIRLLRTFRAVAEMRSFTGAARKLKMSQSGISQQIGVLERELRTPLLVRSNKFEHGKIDRRLILGPRLPNIKCRVIPAHRRTFQDSNKSRQLTCHLVCQPLVSTGC
jgi:hypothetical protein